MSNYWYGTGSRTQRTFTDYQLIVLDDGAHRWGDNYAVGSASDNDAGPTEDGIFYVHPTCLVPYGRVGSLTEFRIIIGTILFLMLSVEANG